MSTFNNISDKDLPEGLDPDLNRKGNNNPFGAGPGYFESFNEKLKGRIEQYEELKTEAPLLSNIPKYNPFEIPAGYFDELPTIIQQKCTTASELPLFEWLKMFFRPNFSIPVLTVLLIAFAGIHYLNNSTEKTDPVAEVINIDEQLQNIDETTIIEALAVASASESDADPENESIKEYLMDNHIDEIN